MQISSFFSSSPTLKPTEDVGLAELRKGHKHRARRILDEVVHDSPETAFQIGEKCLGHDDHLALRYYGQAVKSPDVGLRTRAYRQMALAHFGLQRSCFGLTINLRHNKQMRECYEEARLRDPGAKRGAANIYSAHLDRYSLRLIGDTFSALRNDDYGFPIGSHRVSLRFGLGTRDSSALNSALDLFPEAVREVPATAVSDIEALLHGKLDSSNRERIVKVVVPCLAQLASKPEKRGATEAAHCLKYLWSLPWASRDTVADFQRCRSTTSV